MCPVIFAIIFLSLFNSFPCYRNRRDDRIENLFGESDYDINGDLLSIEEEEKLHRESGICSLEDAPLLRMCSSSDQSGQEGSVNTLPQLKTMSCRCDVSCHVYGDCCIDRVGKYDYHAKSLTCRTVKGPNSYSIPIYVYQLCPHSYSDLFIRSLCEEEAEDRYRRGIYYDHRQDIPVLSVSSGIFYRNVYCSICNKDTDLVKWDTYLYCNGYSNGTRVGFEDMPDFSSAVYVPRTKNYRGVKIHGLSRNCNLNVKNFKINRLISEHGGRLCKAVHEDCPSDSHPETAKKCKLYSSYVYQIVYSSEKRKVFKNFHCARCNNITSEQLSCNDPYSPILFRPPWEDKHGLSMLFDFNFEIGGAGGSSCRLSDGQMWDPIFRQCQNVTCGALFKREDNKCVPVTSPDSKEGLIENCFKKILDTEHFVILPDKKIYVNYSRRTLELNEYEIFEKNNNIISQIAICLDTEAQLLPLSRFHYWLSVVTLSISMICLILHLAIYSVFKTLRNCPGKVLMSLSVALLCGHFFLLLGPHLVDISWLCYLSSVTTHFGYMSAFAWMCVMAFDIHKTFSVTQCKRSNKNKAFIKYSIFSWLSALCIVLVSILFDQLLPSSNKFRPKYGDPICWFNHRFGLLIFFSLPVALLLLINIVLFAKTALHIRTVSRQTKMVNNLSEKTRYFLYLKLAVVLGLTWILGFVAGITKIEAFWYLFIIFNGLQGALIFLAFSVKRKILHMLAIKFRIRSDKYRMGKRTGLKAAMYTSLSNLSSLHPTLSTQLSTTTENKEMLKAVRKLNPDIVVNK